MWIPAFPPPMELMLRRNPFIVLHAIQLNIKRKSAWIAEN